MNKNILLLNGSTRVKGNSLNICNSINRIVLDKGLKCSIENIQGYFNGNNILDIKEKLIDADVIGIVCPLYVDSFPYPVIAFLEELEETFREILKGKSLFVIGQCNFPESRRLTPMILSGECFSKEVDMKWLGSLAYGGSAIRIEGKALENAGKEGQRMIKALDCAMGEIIRGDLISEGAMKLFRNDIHRFLLRAAAFGANMISSAKKRG
ncbi:MAG: hypothetical protein RR636_14790 [Clostridium sp.]|uniref:hypothetical protein n=1 Tax=Clostridium sp. TaxID=1506 RepID=UPI00302BF4AB